MTNIDENLAPEPAPDVDLKSLDIQPTPEEFFVLSRVDGSMTISQICKTSGLGQKKTLQCIEILRDHGLIQFPGESQSQSTSPAAPTSSKPAASNSADHAEDKADDGEEVELGQLIRNRFPIPFNEFEFNEEMMEQMLEIEDPFKRELIFVYEQLNEVDHYQLLGVNADAGRRELRRSYFRMSKRYHPDRFYKKLLGDFEPLVDKIFQRVTKAYQTLSNRNKRKEYDATLHRGRTSHATPIQASTPASRRSEPREVIQGDRKRDMAFKVLVQRGDKAMGDDRITAGLREYRKALTLNRDAELALRVARTLVDHHDHLDDAIGFARAAQKIDPDSGATLTLIGELYELKNAIDDALYHYELALESAPDDPELQARISRLKG